MTLLEFENLELQEQLDLVRHDGTPVANVKTRSKGHVLYALYSFYVELECQYKNGESTVVDARCFGVSTRLDKYLMQIDLSGLGLLDDAA